MDQPPDCQFTSKKKNEVSCLCNINDRVAKRSGTRDHGLAVSVFNF